MVAQFVGRHMVLLRHVAEQCDLRQAMTKVIVDVPGDAGSFGIEAALLQVDTPSQPAIRQVPHEKDQHREDRGHAPIRNHHVCQTNGATAKSIVAPLRFQTPSALAAITRKR